MVTASKSRGALLAIRSKLLRGEPAPIMALERRCLTSHRSVESNKPVDTAPLLDIALTNELRQSPLSGGRAQSLRRGASGMDAARGVKGHGWPLYAGPRSGDGAREVERSETRMEGQDLLVPFGATAKRDSPSRAKPESPGNSAVSIDSMPASPSPRTDPNPAGQTTYLLSPSKSTKPKKT